MVGVEHHDDVGPCCRELLLLRAEQLGDLAVRAVPLDEMRKDRGVRDAEPADDLRHLELRDLTLFGPCANISANGVEGTMARKSRRATSAVRSAVRTRVRQATAAKKVSADAP